jgi:tetratricopeptide (TPR) repeat protein
MTLTASSYSKLLENFEQIDAQQHAILQSLAKRYPYMQSVWVLLWLSGERPEERNDYLVKAATLSSNHGLLQALEFRGYQNWDVPQGEQTPNSSASIIEIEEETELAGVRPRENRVAHALSAVRQTFEIELQEVEPSVKIPVVESPAFELEGEVESTSSVQKSFADWMKLMVSGQTLSSEDSSKSTEQERKFALLDRFLQSNPKINNETSDVFSPKSYENHFDLDEVVTETLAKLLFDQKKYGKAIKAYKALLLKYPEKSSFFADQIKKAKALKAKE